MSEETLDAPNQSEGDTKEGLYFGREVPPDSKEACMPLHGPNQWPAQVCLWLPKTVHLPASSTALFLHVKHLVRWIRL